MISGAEGSEEEISDDKLSTDGSVSANDKPMTVSFGDAGVVDILDSEDESDNAKEESENNDDEISERGFLESEISGEPYIFDYDSFRVEWKVVSHWEGACNVSVSLTNKSDETIHNWNLSFLSEDEIINPYNARITSEGSNGNKWTFKNAEYNQDIRSDESIQFGFQVNYGERIDIPFSYSIDSSEKKVSDTDYEISDQIISSWDGGAVGELHIVNNKDTAIEDWTVTVRTDAVFLTVWGGNIKKVSEDTYEFSCPDYCQNIAPGQTTVIGYQLSGHDTSIEILGLKEWGNKDNTISGNSISDNSVSNNTISENSVSNNSVSDNSVSENKPVTYIESDGHQHIFIDSDEYELLEEGIYLLDVYSDSMTGYIKYENEDQNDCDNENDNETKVESVKLEICDVFDETIWEGDILSDDDFETWSVKDTGFVLGANKLIFEVIFSDGTAMKEELFVINREATNIKNTFIELTDEDDDNIYDYYEKYFGTDPDKKDTDGDGLEDGAELFLLDTDPTDDDTDDDGIKDGDEDEDGDGLNVRKEFELGTSDLSDDSDIDELSDDYEVNVLGTDPTFADTDFDKIIDKEEIDLGLDPLNPDSDGDGIIDGDETITREVSKDYNGEAIDKVCVSIGCKGSMENKLFINKASDKSGILHDTAGLIGEFYDIECDADFETADIIFSYDESMLGDTDESDLRLIWYNEETREFVLLKDSVVDIENNTVSYTTTHFSDWGVVDGKAYEEVFDTPNTPGMSGTDNPYIGNEKFKYIQDYYYISLDFTASPEDIEKQLQVTQAIIDQMDGYDYLFITCYGSEYQHEQGYRVGSLNCWTSEGWCPSGSFMYGYDGIAKLLDYSNNNIFIEEQSTYSGHFARELSRIAVYRKGQQGIVSENYKAYVFYSGSRYDEKIEKSLDGSSMYTYGEGYSYDPSLRESIKVAADTDLILNTVSIGNPYYDSSKYMDELIPETGGKSYSDVDGIAALVNEVIKDLDDQKEAQRQGDSDGDGLPDGHELDGMIGDNGHIYYSCPYTSISHDTDGDDVPDNVEMGEYNPVTGTYKVLSDPNDPNSVPSDDDSEPVYIIGWSYNKDTVKAFEHKYKERFPFLNGDEFTTEWTDQVWDLFEETDAFSRAAQTKVWELVDSGISRERIFLRRIDGDIQIDKEKNMVYFRGGENCFYLIWNNEWREFQTIQEIHLYTHGYIGHAGMYDTPKTTRIEDISLYPKLNWEDNGKFYFHGCHTAEIFTDDDTKETYYPLQRCANNQGVRVYGNKTAANLSSDPKEYKMITDSSKSVYLGAYGISPKDVISRSEFTWSDWKEAGNTIIPMTEFSPE